VAAAIISMAVAIVLGVILFVVTQSVLVATDTTGWSALQVTLAYLLPTVLLIGITVMIFKVVAGKSNS
jgi:hypothetical protein